MKQVLILAFLLWPPALASQSAKTTLKDPLLAKAFNRISDRLVCRCGCNLILRVCNHENCPSAIPMRKQIEERLLAGVDEEEIVQEFVDEYGLVVLSTPPTKGLNLGAWVMPGFAMAAGLFIVLYLLSGWLRKKGTSSAPSPPIDDGLRERIEREIREREEK